MKTKYISLLMLALAAVVFIYPGKLLAAQESAKGLGIAYIDSQRVVDESKAGKEYSKEIEELGKKNIEEIAKRDKEIKSLEEELQKQKLVLSPEAQNQKEEVIRRKGIELKRFKEDKEQEFKEQYIKQLNKIKEEITQIVQKIGQEKGYALIITKDDSIIYADPSHDITSLVIEAYDKALAKGTMK